MPGEVGETAALHCTAAGKVVLAAAAPADRARLLPRTLPARTPSTITDRQALWAGERLVAAVAVPASRFAGREDELAGLLRGWSAAVCITKETGVANETPRSPAMR